VGGVLEQLEPRLAQPAPADEPAHPVPKERCMKTSKRFARPSRFLIGGVAALGLTLAVVNAPPAFAGRGDDIVVPEVPRDLQVPVGHKVYRQGLGIGTQNYICMPCPNALTPADKCPASGFAWAFFGPQATLFEVDGADAQQTMTHFNSPNPEEAGRERPTWQDSRDSSAVWGNNGFPPAKSSTDSRFVRDGAIPWLFLPMAGTQVGPTGGDRLAETTFIQRLDTEGGVAPDASTCATPDDVGHKALRPYSADYFFYKAAE
jgi:Protein of unknown function (DUF3455)